MKKSLIIFVALICLGMFTGCGNGTGDSDNSSFKAISTVSQNSKTVLSGEDGTKTGEKMFNGEFGTNLAYDFVYPCPDEDGVFTGDFCDYFTDSDGMNVYYCRFVNTDGELSDLITNNEPEFIQAIRADQIFNKDSIKVNITSSEDVTILDRKIRKIAGYVEGEIDSRIDDGGREKVKAKKDFVSDWYVIENNDSMFKGMAFAVVVSPNEIGSKTMDELDNYLELIHENMHK